MQSTFNYNEILNSLVTNSQKIPTNYKNKLWFETKKKNIFKTLSPQLTLTDVRANKNLQLLYNCLREK